MSKSKERVESLRKFLEKFDFSFENTVLKFDKYQSSRMLKILERISKIFWKVELSLIIKESLEKHE